MNVEKILDLIGQDYINKTVLMPHDVARETFQVPRLVVTAHDEFKFIVTNYVQHHKNSVGEGQPSFAAAFGEAKNILDRAFQEDQFQEGYPRALQVAFDGTEGGMRRVINEIADALRRRAMQEYIDHVFHHHVNVLSKADNELLSEAFFQRFGPILERFGFKVDKHTWAFNTRAALEYHRQAIEQIMAIAKKI